MLITSVRRVAAVVLLILCTACETSAPTSPSGSAMPPATPLSTNFPPLSGPSRTFIFDRELSFPVTDYTKQSRLVLYENGAFVLQYPSLGHAGYRGGYRDASGVITFEWEGWSSAGPWGAIGDLKGEALTVRYNTIMQLSDFDDGVYVLMR